MKRKYWYYPLTGLVIAALAFGSFFFGRLLPDYKDTVQVHREVPAVVQPLNDSEELLMYPWNLYDGKKYMTVGNPVLWEEDLSYGESDITAGEFLLPYLLLDAFAKDFQPKDTDLWCDGIMFVYNGEDNIYFLKDYQYVNSYGRKCVISAAIRGSYIIDLKCSFVEREEYTEEQMEQTRANIQEWLKDSEKWLSDDLNLEYYTINSPIYDFVRHCRVLSQYIEESYVAVNPYYQFNIYPSGETVLFYDDCFIIPFYDRGTERTVYLFFNPEANGIVGFNLNGQQ